MRTTNRPKPVAFAAASSLGKFIACWCLPSIPWFKGIQTAHSLGNSLPGVAQDNHFWQPWITRRYARRQILQSMAVEKRDSNNLNGSRNAELTLTYPLPFFVGTLVCEQTDPASKAFCENKKVETVTVCIRGWSGSLTNCSFLFQQWNAARFEVRNTNVDRFTPTPWQFILL